MNNKLSNLKNHFESRLSDGSVFTEMDKIRIRQRLDRQRKGYGQSFSFIPRTVSVIFLSSLFICIAGFAAFQLGLVDIKNHQGDLELSAEKTKVNDEKAKGEAIGTEKAEYIVSDKDQEEAAKEIGPINDEMTLITRMIEMTFQKVTFGGQQLTPRGIAPGSVHRIQMTKGNIDYLKKSLDSIKISMNKDTEGYDYKSILNRWLKGSFEDIAREDKILLSLLTNGKYTGDEITKKSSLEEQTYILYFFGDDDMKLHNEQWRTKKQ